MFEKISARLLWVLLLPIAGAQTAITNEPAPAVDLVAVRTNAYLADWDGWELRPLQKARRQAELIFKSDFSPAGLARWWLPDGVGVDPKNDRVVISLDPKAAAAGINWGVLWSKLPVFAPFMVEVEFTLSPDSPHDANLFWGQNAPSKANIGREQECYMAGFFGWGGQACGIERTSDWQTFGITGAADPKPGVKRTGVWIVDGKVQCLYLDGALVLYSRTNEKPPVSGYFGLGILMSRVTFHSVKAFRLNPLKK